MTNKTIGWGIILSYGMAIIGSTAGYSDDAIGIVGLVMIFFAGYAVKRLWDK